MRENKINKYYFGNFHRCFDARYIRPYNDGKKIMTVRVNGTRLVYATLPNVTLVYVSRGNQQSNVPSANDNTL